MSKSARILELYAKGLSTREISHEVGCSTAYVRVCARQRQGRRSKHDANYRASPAGRAAYVGDLARRRAMLETSDIKKVRAASRQAYADARAKGLSRHEAHDFAWRARERAIRKLGDRSLARAKASEARKHYLGHISKEGSDDGHPAANA